MAAILRYRDEPERRRHIGGEAALTLLRDALGGTAAPA